MSWKQFTAAPSRRTRMEFALISQSTDCAQQPSAQLRRRTFAALQEATTGAPMVQTLQSAFRPALAVFACMLIMCAVIAAWLSPSPSTRPVADHASRIAQPNEAPGMIVRFLSLIEQPIPDTDAGPWQGRDPRARPAC